jgi:hypothetical protein
MVSNNSSHFSGQLEKRQPAIDATKEEQPGPSVELGGAVAIPLPLPLLLLSETSNRPSKRLSHALGQEE